MFFPVIYQEEIQSWTHPSLYFFIYYHNLLLLFCNAEISIQKSDLFLFLKRELQLSLVISYGA